MKEQYIGMDERTEQMAMPEVQIDTVLEHGFGYGSGTICASELRTEAGPEACAAAETVIRDPNQILVAVDTDDDGEQIDDDGCGDGRGVKLVFKGLVEKARSLHRAKVFGGGVAMIGASLIGTGRARSQQLNELFGSAIGVMKDKMINFGAHTAEHVAPGREEIDSGCGALDKAPEVIEAVVEHQEMIRESIAQLGISDEGLDDVLEHFSAYRNLISGQPYAGKKVVGDIVDEGKIVKQLEGRHTEIATILNMVRGYTVNQKAVRDATDGLLQVFGVDVWRMQDYAEQLHPDDTALQQQAFLSELVYTLGTAAVLTRGDQPVYVIQAASLAAAL